MLSIRFFRTGKKNQPSFKIVVTKKTNSSTRGRFIEQVGTYNPTTKEKTLNIERAKYWLGVGAKPSDTVYNLLVSEKVIDGKKIDLHKKSKTQVATKGKDEASASSPKTEAVIEEDKSSSLSSSSKEDSEKKEQSVVEEKPVESEKPVAKTIGEDSPLQS